MYTRLPVHDHDAREENRRKQDDMVGNKKRENGEKRREY